MKIGSLWTDRIVDLCRTTYELTSPLLIFNGAFTEHFRTSTTYWAELMAAKRAVKQIFSLEISAGTLHLVISKGCN